MSEPDKVSFAAFYLIWADIQGWKVPDLHLRVCDWLERLGGRVRVLLVFRGAAKSTIYGVYKAWRLYRDQTLRNQVWAADDKLALKMTRYTRHVLRVHPLCRGILPNVNAVREFWVNGAMDMRNPSMSANGILSNATGSRADEIDFDDIEVPKNIKTVEAREILRTRMSETTHILVPGGRKTFIGTPHTHESIYEEQVAGGAEVLRIPLFKHSRRFENPGDRKRFPAPFGPESDGYTILVGIGKFARTLEQGKDFHVVKGELRFFEPPGVTFDICTGNAWAERFNSEEVEHRRRECRTFNEWDSQYQLHARPIGDIRLDPAKIRAYACEPTVTEVNNVTLMMLGETRIVGASAFWDCALGKVKSDASAFSLVLTDEAGQLYWHVAKALVGELAEFDSRGQIASGQCAQVRELVIRYSIPRVTIETNGPGGFVPPILRRALAGTGCAVAEHTSTQDKRRRILDALEPPLSSRFLWAHTSVLDGPLWDQMKDFNPVVKEQPDDYLDSGAGAIAETPVRIGKVLGTKVRAQQSNDWRPSSGVHEVAFDTT